MTAVSAVAVLVSPLALTSASSADPAFSVRAQVLQVGLDELVKDTLVPGAQLVLTEHGTDTQINGGVGDVATGAAFPDNAQVRIASNTKAFVATVVLQLVAEHRVELDAPLERYLPGRVYGPGGDGRVITVRNLLQHTSGIPNYLPYLDLGSVDALRRSRPADELIRLGLDHPAEFTPGSAFGYSNTNYLLAGELIEQVTGSLVSVEITRRILVPLGLGHTYWPLFPVENVIRQPHPHGYHNFGGTRVDITDIDPGWGLPDGALVSTGADLNRFFMALVSGRLLPPEVQTEMMHTIPTNEPARPREAGLGLFRRINSCGMETWGHGGAMNGFLVFGAATTDRAVTVSTNELTGFLVMGVYLGAMNALVDAALCG
ncbi:serine hydrolase domain-containing protein [Nocardia sp. NBC_01009]|uniref:serine hydrolase domain-containing protein n=1 Tax=Nocardia sp. NBC_01009 TaxID=2975996 RepID=UPI0038653C55|nr:beta-lactamase family protein [Nocardia sp. NBC_01009]